jgi:alpha-galactosidase
MSLSKKYHVIFFLVFLGYCRFVYSIEPYGSERFEQNRWVSAKFEGKADKSAVLMVVENNDSVQQNGRFEKPFNIGGKQYTRGLFCHALSKVIISLPSPGKSFTTVVGVDSNNQTSGGRGSVVFSVAINDKKSFDSGIMREGMTALPVQVDLNGAREFVIAVSDGGDGIACDQADWADAKVELANGDEIWLGDMMILDGVLKPLTTEPMFSFMYDNKSFVELIDKWEIKRKKKNQDSHRIQHEITYRDPQTDLLVRCIGVEWKDYPTIEWTLYFKNEGSQETPILKNIQALDMDLSRGEAGEFLLHHAVGSIMAANDFQPLETALAPGTTQRIGAADGRPTKSDMSYFNLEFPTKQQGIIVAVGWPGQWASEWIRDSGNRLRVTAGQELTHFKLLPGEEVRTPLIVLQFWSGDWMYAQNIWRRWMLAHNLPKPGGEDLKPYMFGCSSFYFQEMYKATETNQIEFISRYLEEKIKIDYWWMDAGWYLCEPVGWWKTGTWEVDTTRFPNGLRAISDYAHTKDIKTIVWFEPERVYPGTWLDENHPEWIFRGEGGWAGGELLNEGNPEVLKWLIEHMNQLITDEGIDLYREDSNIDPLGFWRGNDAEDRQGITENHYVQGHLSYWDSILQRHPGILIDSCSSGGRRLDLESMRRAVPFWRSDYCLDAIGTQCHSYGLPFWIPLSGTGTAWITSYNFRSNMVPFLNYIWDMRDQNVDYDLLRRMTRQFRQVAHYYWGDYYPLTSFSTAADVWMAWQYDKPEIGEGMVQAFRRKDSYYLSSQFKLIGLDPAALYEINNLDTSDKIIQTGQELMQKGLKIIIEEQPDAVIIVYKKI